MKNNLFLKVFLIVLGTTVLASLVSVNAFRKAHREDPQLNKRLAEKMSKSHFHLTLDDSASEVDQNEHLKFDLKMSAVKVRTKAANIEIRGTSGQQIEVSVAGKRHPEQQSSLIRTVAGKDSVEISEGSSSISGLTLLIPQNYRGKLEIASLSGDVRIREIHVESLDVTTASGDIALEEAKAGQIDLHSLSGDIDVDSDSASQFQVETLSGDIAFLLNHPEAALYDLKTASGEISNPFKSQAKASLQIVAKTASGNIQIEKASH